MPRSVMLSVHAGCRHAHEPRVVQRRRHGPTSETLRYHRAVCAGSMRTSTRPSSSPTLARHKSSVALPCGEQSPGAALASPDPECRVNRSLTVSTTFFFSRLYIAGPLALNNLLFKCATHAIHPRTGSSHHRSPIVATQHRSVWMGQHDLGLARTIFHPASTYAE